MSEIYPFEATQGVVTISHTCYHWRAVALSTPSLWIRCIPKKDAALQVFLSRSSRIPMVLDISFNSNRSYQDYYIQLLFNELPRARGLYIDLSQKCGQDGFQDIEGTWRFLQILQNMPPSIEHLHISASGVWHSPTVRDTRQWMPLDLKDQDCLARLRHLFLRSISIEWDCGLLRDLHTLTLMDRKSDPISLSRLSDIASACPELEELVIQDTSWENEPVDTEKRKQPIRFPRLRPARISINNPNSAGALVFRMISPSEARIWINVSKVYVSEFTFLALVAEVTTFLQRMPGPLERLGLSLGYNAGIYTSIKNSTGVLVISVENMRPTGYGIFFMRPLLFQDLSHLIEIECNACEDAPFHHSKYWWHTILAKAPGIRRLAFGSEAQAMTVLDALMPAGEKDIHTSGGHTIIDADQEDTTDTLIGALPATSLPLPHLTHIAATDTSLECRWHLRDSELTLHQLGKNNGTGFHYLKRFLDMRQRQSCCIEKLTLGLSMYAKEPRLPKLLEGFDVRFERLDRCLPGPNFLFDPRYEWDRELNLGCPKDSLLE